MFLLFFCLKKSTFATWNSKKKTNAICGWRSMKPRSPMRQVRFPSVP